MPIRFRRAVSSDGSAIAVCHLRQAGRLEGYYLKQRPVYVYGTLLTGTQGTFSDVVDASLSLDDAIGAHWPGASISDPALLPGQYHPRVWRGPESPALIGEHASAESRRAADQGAWVRAGRSALLLATLLRDIVSVVEPDSRNAGVFGSAIRQLLIVACTEVEACMRGILQQNVVSLPKRPSTRHYVHLMHPLRLDEWVLRLTAAPGLPPVAPFRDWSADRPTESLDWYNAYNATKHDPEGNPDAPTLMRAVQAVAAHSALVFAQFGPGSLNPFGLPEIASFFAADAPKWEPDEVYLPFLGDRTTWEPRPLFGSTPPWSENGEES